LQHFHDQVFKIQKKIIKEETAEKLENKEGEKLKLVKKQNSNSGKQGKSDEFAKPADAKEEDLIEVHAPFYPEKKNELWWLIIGDERTNRVVGITRIASLKHGTEARIPFQAPPKPATYTYTLLLLSDSYVGFDQHILFKLQVAKELPIPKEEKFDDDDNNEPYSDEDENDEQKPIIEDEEKPRIEDEKQVEEDEESVGSDEEN